MIIWRNLGCGNNFFDDLVINEEILAEFFFIPEIIFFEKIDEFLGVVVEQFESIKYLVLSI